MKQSKTDRLRHLAEGLTVSGENHEKFTRLLEKCDDVEELRELAAEYTPHAEISVPVYQRLAELLPDDAKIAADLGFVFWLCGRDEDAREQAAKAQTLDPKNIQGLLLKAALAKGEEQRDLYRKVLEIDPRNEIAQANLQASTTGDK